MPKQFRVLVIGAGSIGERHTRCFQETGRAEVSLCEIDPQVRETVAARYHLRDVFDDLDAAIANPPDVAVICTPAHLHVPMATQLADAGIHPLIEKPLSVSLDGVDRLKALVKQRALVAAVAYVHRANPVLAEMRQAILDGRFGRPVQLVAVCGHNFPHDRPAYREIYYTDRATGGGAVQDGLTHMINTGEWLVGPVTELAADAAHLVLEGVEVEDSVHVIARHGPVLASYALNQHQALSENTITVLCRQGTLRAETHRGRWRWVTGPEDQWHDETHPTQQRDTLFVAQADAFLDAVEGKIPPLCTLDEGVHTLRVNLAVLAAADNRTWQSLRP